MRTFRMLGFGDYTESEKASTLKERDHKDATDLAVERERERRLRRFGGSAAHAQRV